ncbi:hypothetical protein RQP46_010759 [Phenoliferia psychrophenolica]
MDDTLEPENEASAPCGSSSSDPAPSTPALPLPTLAQAIRALTTDDLIALLLKHPECALDITTTAAPFHAVVEEEDFWKDPWGSAALAGAVADLRSAVGIKEPSAGASGREAGRAAVRRVTARIAELTIKRGEWRKGVERIVQLNNKWANAVRDQLDPYPTYSITKPVGPEGSVPYDPALGVVRSAMDDLAAERRAVAAIRLERIGTDQGYCVSHTVSPALIAEWERAWDGDLFDPDAVFSGAPEIPRPTLKARESTIQSAILFSTLPPEIVTMILEEGARNAMAAARTPQDLSTPRRQAFLKVTSRVSRVWRDVSQAMLIAYPHFQSPFKINRFVTLLEQTRQPNLVRKVFLHVGDIFEPRIKFSRSQKLYKATCATLETLWMACPDAREVELCGTGNSKHVLEYRTMVKNQPHGEAKHPRPPRATFLPDHLTTLSLIDFNFGYSKTGIPLILYHMSGLPIRHLTILRGKFEDTPFGRPSDLGRKTSPVDLSALLFLTLDDSPPIVPLLATHPPNVTTVTLTRPTSATSQSTQAYYGQPAPVPPSRESIKESIYDLPSLKVLLLPGSEKEELWGSFAEIVEKAGKEVEVRWET